MSILDRFYEQWNKSMSKSAQMYGNPGPMGNPGHTGTMVKEVPMEMDKPKLPPTPPSFKKDDKKTEIKKGVEKILSEFRVTDLKLIDKLVDYVHEMVEGKEPKKEKKDDLPPFMKDKSKREDKETLKDETKKDETPKEEEVKKAMLNERELLEAVALTKYMRGEGAKDDAIANELMGAYPTINADDVDRIMTNPEATPTRVGPPSIKEREMLRKELERMESELSHDEKRRFMTFLDEATGKGKITPQEKENIVRVLGAVKSKNNVEVEKLVDAMQHACRVLTAWKITPTTKLIFDLAKVAVRKCQS